VGNLNLNQILGLKMHIMSVCKTWIKAIQFKYGILKYQSIKEMITYEYARHHRRSQTSRL
jgi:hypothetical protein